MNAMNGIIGGADPVARLAMNTILTDGASPVSGPAPGIACYCRGTHIRTPAGEMPIEDLAIGDLVSTVSGEARPIRWIGRRIYAGRFIAGNRAMLPIRIRAGALQDGVPHRDLYVSPEHALFLDDALVRAELLVNDTSIVRCDTTGTVAYFHIELAAHDVIFAEGAPAETFADCGGRGMFHNASDYHRRYPDAPAPAWRFCAPRLLAASDGVAAIRARLAERAGAVGHPGPADQLKGYIDTLDRTEVAGWAFDPTRPHAPVRLEIRCDGEVVGHVMADRHRSDLEETGILGDGHCAFRFAFPVHPRPLTSHMVEIVRAEDGAPIPGSPKLLAAVADLDADCRDAIAALLRDAAQAATQASDLDATIAYLMAETEMLLAARAWLEAGARAYAHGPDDRWGGLVPTEAVRDAAPALHPRALFVDDLVPAPNEHGGATVALDHMRALMRIGFEVSFIASQDLDDRRACAGALAASGVRPLTAPWYRSVEEALARHAGQFDLIFLHRASNAAAYAKLARLHCPAALLVYSVADLHHLRLSRQGAVEDRPEVIRHAEQLRVEEMFAARLADLVITHSGVEAALLRREIPGIALAVVPWSVRLRATPKRFAEHDRVVFLGSFGHEPNVDAVHWLAEEIVPLALCREPAMRFQVVGSGMPQSLRLLARPGLDLVGHVEDLDAVLSAARLTVAPLRYGAGLKAKVLDSLGAGVPCIGTSIAYEGMTLPPALADCVADTPGAIAAMLVRLWRDEAAHAAAAEASLEYARANYSSDRIDALLRQALAPALHRWAGGAESSTGPLGRADGRSAVETALSWSAAPAGGPSAELAMARSAPAEA